MPRTLRHPNGHRTSRRWVAARRRGARRRRAIIPRASMHCWYRQVEDTIAGRLVVVLVKTHCSCTGRASDGFTETQSSMKSPCVRTPPMRSRVPCSLRFVKVVRIQFPTKQAITHETMTPLKVRSHVRAHGLSGGQRLPREVYRKDAAVPRKVTQSQPACVSLNALPCDREP